MKTTDQLIKPFIFLLLTLIFSHSEIHSSVITVSGPINKSTTWDADTVKVFGDVLIKNGVLTIQPGTVVEFQGRFSLIADPGRIQALGTPGDTICFTIHDTTGYHGPNPSQGGWDGISLTGNSEFKYCKFQFAKPMDVFIAITNDNKHHEFQNCVISDIRKNGICSPFENSSLNLKNCTIKNIEGTGIIGTNIDVDHCIIKNTKYGINNIGHLVPGNPNITNCLIEFNETGICLASSRAVITGNIIQNNDVGVYIAFDSCSFLANNMIRNNLSSGILAKATQNLFVVNNLVYNNGEGIHLYECSFKVINSTIINNRGYGINGINITSILYNCIFRGNADPDKGQIYGSNGGDGYFHGHLYNNNIEDISGLKIAGSMINNIDMDPCFMDVLNTDFRLQSCSPCINTGIEDTTGLNLPEYDLDINPRIFGVAIDMGAYEAQYQTTGCVDHIYKGESGTISDQSFDLDYENNAECYKTIIAEEGKRILLEFTEFNTEEGYDWVYVYDGEYPASPTIGVFSGNTIPGKVFSSGNKMLLMFRSDNSVTKPGWTANYKAVCPCVDEILTSSSGIIQSNSEGTEYLNNEDCVKKIITDEGMQIVLEFEQFDLEDGYDWIWVYDGAYPSAPLIGTYSGNILPETIQSSGNALYIHFHSDYSITKSGWKASYSVNSSHKSTEKLHNEIPDNIINLEIYPNPTDGKVILFFEKEMKRVNIELYDLQGQIISNTVEYPVNRKLILDFKESGSGLYFLKIKTDEQCFEKKIIIEK
ncbi:MAG: T9SS type A sorting domain-containing protein [Bacteroidales bacterium]|nr:T9SS type A sorting domain-containing protein [Bacteroidales bacterium]